MRQWSSPYLAQSSSFHFWLSTPLAFWGWIICETLQGISSEWCVLTASTVSRTGTSTVRPHDHFPPLDYLEFDHVVVESLGIDAATAEALGVGYAGKGMMKGYVAIPVRRLTGELTGYIGIVEGKVPKEFHLSRVVTFPKKSA
jgi:hypothetical protein